MRERLLRSPSEGDAEGYGNGKRRGSILRTMMQDAKKMMPAGDSPEPASVSFCEERCYSASSTTQTATRFSSATGETFSVSPL